MSWVWFSPALVEFGEPPDRDGAERTIWLHADPHAVLDVPSGSDRDSLRRAYRRSARVRHPDAEAAQGSFQELQCALSVALGEDDGEVTVQPAAGSWWSFCEFVRPTDCTLGRDAVAGLVFELHDLDAVPLRQAEETVHVTYGGQTLPLAIRYSRSLTARPVLIAKTATAGRRLTTPRQARGGQPRADRPARPRRHRRHADVRTVTAGSPRVAVGPE